MREEALAAIAAAADLEQLKQARLDHAGDRSPLALANREIGALPPQARKEAGQRVGQARGAVSTALAERQAVLEAEHEERMLVTETVDVTLPVDRSRVGSRHPITLQSELIADIFVAMGWEIAEGPVVEAEWLNFDALNLGPDHPARTMQDTFWTEPADHHVVLRTQTSPVQARTMLTRKPPIYVACPGRVFRTDEYDATHSPMFHQVEGLVVDEGITMAHLKGSLDHLAARLFGDGIDTRFRPSYFPFTEPSAEVDVRCFVCRGEDSDACRTCKGEGWIEWGGCGVVNPASWSPAAWTPRSTQGSRSGWASTGPSCSGTTWATCDRCSRATHASRPPSAPRSEERDEGPAVLDQGVRRRPRRRDHRRADPSAHAHRPQARGHRQPRRPDHRSAGDRPGAHQGARAAEERQDDQLVHGRRRRRQRHW